MTRRQLFTSAAAIVPLHAFFELPLQAETPTVSAMWMLDPLGNINLFLRGPQATVAIAEVVYDDDGTLRSATGACNLLPLRDGEGHNGMIAIPVASHNVRLRWINVRVYPDEPMVEVTATNVMPAVEVQ